MRRSFGIGLALLGLTVMAGCAAAPKGTDAKADLSREVKNTVESYESQDPGMKKFLNDAYAYAVFPSVGKGGAVVGGAFGQGQLFEQGKMIGYVSVSKASVGLQLGGQTFSEIIAFENAAAVNNLKDGKLNFSANVSAVLLKSGAAAAANYREGVVVFTKPNGGAMFEVSVGGQSFKYQDASTAKQIDQSRMDNNKSDNDNDNDSMNQ
jgi:lipid-binding SYLF domain-containing protein